MVAAGTGLIADKIADSLDIESLVYCAGLHIAAAVPAVVFLRLVRSSYLILFEKECPILFHSTRKTLNLGVQSAYSFYKIFHCA